MESENNDYVGRVDQIDSAELDNEFLSGIIQSKSDEVFRLLSPTSFIHKIKPEISLTLKLGFYYFTICSHQKATLGQQLIGFYYKTSTSLNEKNKNLVYVLYLFLNTFPAYVHQRWSLLSGIWRRISSGNQEALKNHDIVVTRFKQAYEILEKVVSILSILNTLIFLQEGKHPTLITRVLNLIPVSTKGSSPGRDVGYNFVSRELLWYSFLELVTSVLPSINVPFIKTWIQNKYKFYIANKDEKEKFDILHMRGERKENLNGISAEVLKECKICKQSPIILPSTGGCGHYYCYYCISGNIVASSEKFFLCPECNFPLTKENLCFQTSVNVR